MFYVYFLSSDKYNQYYVGSTNDLKRRFNEHNEGKNFYTKRYKPWKLLYYEAYQSKKLARMREKRLKQHGNAIRELKKRISDRLYPAPKHGAGFTLIELLVVISIIGTLVGLIVNNLSDARARARDVRRKSDLVQLKTALRLYYNDYQQYPAGAGTLDGCGAAGDQTCPDGGTFSAGAGDTIYMKTLPADLNYQSGGEDEFLITTTLENVSDPDLATSQASCPGGPITDFAVCSD